MNRTHSEGRRSPMRHSGWAILFAGIIGVGGTAAVAQDGTPDASSESEVDVVLENTDEEEVGTASFTEADGVVTILVDVSDLSEGDHGIHIHETGTCDPSGDEPFSSAGDHFNPTDAEHGSGASGDDDDAESSHAGDLGNITVEEDGTGTLEIETEQVTLESGEDNSLAGDQGSALLIHEDPDDLETDPSGESGAPIACGTIFEPSNGTPAASSDESEASEEGVDAEETADEPVEALDSLEFSPSMITASPGDAIEVTNVGSLEHNFVVDELDIEVDLPSGEVVEVEIPDDAEPGEYEFVCTVSGHEEAGMVGTLIIE